MRGVKIGWSVPHPIKSLSCDQFLPIIGKAGASIKGEVCFERSGREIVPNSKVAAGRVDSRPQIDLANVLNLGHTVFVKPIQFHPKALDFIRGQSTEIKQAIGEALRDVQKGMSMGMPLSRPMPDVASGVHELRIKDEHLAVRVFYFVKMADAILVFHGFQKQTQKTPKHEIAAGQKRLREVFDGKV